MTHYCHHCGKEVENGNKFCPYCGALQDRYSDDYRYEERKDEYEESKTSSSKVAKEAQTGLDLAVESLREGFRKKLFSVDELMAAAEADRVARIVTPYLEAIIE